MIRQFILGFLTLCLWLGCQPNTKPQAKESTNALPATSNPTDSIPEQPADIGLLPPFLLEGARDTFPIADFFPQPDRIDSVTTDPMNTLRLNWLKEHQALEVRLIGDAPRLSYLDFHLGATRHSVLVKMPTKKNVTLRLRDQGYQQVQVTGEMNNWNPTAASMDLSKSGIWEYTFQLEPGKYRYKFVVDGKEMLDPKNPNQVSAGDQGKSSQLSLPQPPSDHLPSLRPTAHNAREIELTLEKNGAVLAFWQNQRLEVRKAGKLVYIPVPEAAGEKTRSYIRAWAQNEFGISTEINIPLEHGLVPSDAATSLFR